MAARIPGQCTLRYHAHVETYNSKSRNTCSASRWHERRGCLRAQIEQKKREKARRAAGKQHKPLFEEDGVQRGMLDKYDEEEEEVGMEIDDTGAVNDEKARKQAEIRAKLAAGGCLGLEEVSSDAAVAVVMVQVLVLQNHAVVLVFIV